MEGRVRHLFPNTLYIDLGKDMLVITKKTYSSPISVNISSGGVPPLSGLVREGDVARRVGSDLRVGGLRVSLDSAETYGPHRLECAGTRVLKEVGGVLGRAAFMASLLYSVAHSTFTITEIGEFRDFIQLVPVRFARGEQDVLGMEGAYRMILGLGEGFTPSGDDFLSGFIGVFNLFHKILRIPRISIRPETLFSSTSWASAMLLNYVQRGLVDEPLRRLLHGLGAGEPDLFLDAVLGMGSRGHTSGLDTALGAVVAAASLHDHIYRGSLLNKVLSEILIN